MRIPRAETFSQVGLSPDDCRNFNTIQEYLLTKHNSFYQNRTTMKYILALLAEHPEIFDNYKVTPKQIF